MTNWSTDVCRFANEVPPTAAAHVDAEVTAVAGVEQQVVIGSAAEPGQPDDAAVATADIMKDDRPMDEGKEPVDASATLSQCQLLLSDVICSLKYLYIACYCLNSQCAVYWVRCT